MPLIRRSDYKRPFYLFNKHLETIVPSLFRKVNLKQYARERITTLDDDFLDLDWIKNNNERLVIISHGLEGNSERHYVKGVAKYFYERGWDVLAWNCRSCSGEMNNTKKFYHHGATGDLKLVVDYALIQNKYKQISMVGASMGGSLTLKFLGENNSDLDHRIVNAATFSVPCDLKSSVDQLELQSNSFYKRRFLRKLKYKIKMKSLLMPDEIKPDNLQRVRTLTDFDNCYTAPLHGFNGAEDFYSKASAIHYLENINRPVLIVNAKNDPFLPEACSPVELASGHSYVYLETPEHGGHVGFSLVSKTYSWAEKRAFEFVNQNL